MISERQLDHLEMLDVALDQLKLFNKIIPASNAVEVAKQEVFKHYHGATREVVMEQGKPLQIKVDYEMVNILGGRNSGR